MNEEKKARGRPRKYETDAERKKAYRERQKELQDKLATRAKRITELQGRIDKMERNMVRSTYTDQKIPDAITDVHEQIKDRSRKYTPSELMDLDIEELKRIRESIQSRYYGNFYSPLLAALESAIMPSVDQEFDSRPLVTEDKSYDVILAEKLAKPEDKITPKTNLTTLEYLQKAKKKDVEQIAENLATKPSTMEKKPKDNSKHWVHLKTPFRTDQLLDVFQELFQLYAVEAELSRRERMSDQERDLEQLEKRLEEIEKTMKDEKLYHIKTKVGTELKQKQKEMKTNEKKTNENKVKKKDSKQK